MKVCMCDGGCSILQPESRVRPNKATILPNELQGCMIINCFVASNECSITWVGFTGTVPDILWL